jgi:hypothetical protein
MMLRLRRAADFVIEQNGRPYLRRWWILPRNRWFNVYLHHFMASDDDRALHDHPWWNLSLLLRGRYVEFVQRADGSTIGLTRRPGQFGLLRRPEQAHRVALLSDGQGGELPVWTLFITGPRVREWGFLCPQGWRHWQDYVAVTETGNDTGRGCD